MRSIEALLRRHIGLDATAIGSSLIERTVRRRMKQNGVQQMESYCDLVGNSHHELEQLIEAVVVTETWFFRDREPFQRFADLALQKAKLNPSASRLRVLSLPCATGEEPYSLAMALLDAGVTPPTFTINAVDISANALTRAEAAVYTKNSFRGRELAFRDRHFLPAEADYALNPRVRRCVTFERGNILDADFLVASAPFDFIFCRNLLIYFDRAAQILALGKIHQLLAEDGVLFVGPAELPLVVDRGFISAGLPMAFACHKASRGPEVKIGGQKPNHRPLTSGHASPTPVEAIPDLAIARQHADAGRLVEAAAICQACLTRDAASAQAYYLLGLVNDARNDAAAIACYRKALYLEPNHYEALVHLTLALEKAGDLNAARIYHRRAERAQPNA